MRHLQTVVHMEDKTMWFELRRKELEDLNSSYESNLKARRKRELTLIVTCLIALIYAFPVKDFTTNPEIEIPAISLKILLKDAITVFPTIISSVYLIYFSTVINQLWINVRRIGLRQSIEKYIESGTINDDYRYSRQRSVFQFRQVYLPSPLHVRGSMDTSSLHLLSRGLVDVFVGLVFNVVPYITIIFVTIKSFTLSHNKYFLYWNISCVVIMLASFISTIFANPKR